MTPCWASFSSASSVHRTSIHDISPSVAFVLEYNIVTILSSAEIATRWCVKTGLEARSGRGARPVLGRFVVAAFPRAMEPAAGSVAATAVRGTAIRVRSEHKAESVSGALIGRGGKPVERPTPYRLRGRDWTPGQDAGLVPIAKQLDASLPEEGRRELEG